MEPHRDPRRLWFRAVTRRGRGQVTSRSGVLKPARSPRHYWRKCEGEREACRNSSKLQGKDKSSRRLTQMNAELEIRPRIATDQHGLGEEGATN